MALPAATDFTGSSITEAQFKTAMTNLRAYLAGLLGTTGDAADALTALGAIQADVDGKISTSLMPTTPYLTGESFLETVDYPTLSVSAADSYDITAFSGSQGGSTSLATTTYTIAREYTIPANITGSARFNASHRSSTAGQTVSLQLLKNGSVVNTWSTTSTSPQARTADVTIVPGDVITWQHKASAGGVTTTVESISVRADKGYAAVTAYKQLP